MAFTLPSDLATNLVDNSSTVDAAYFNGVSAMGNALKAAIGTIGYGSRTATVATSETSASTSYTDLATTTDQVTVAIGSSGKAVVFFDVESSDSSGYYSYTSVDVSGANTIAASDANAIRFMPGSANPGHLGMPILMTGLTAGITTFKLKYKVSTGTGTWLNRRITVIPLPATDGTHATANLPIDISSSLSLGMGGELRSNKASFNLGVTPAISMTGVRTPPVYQGANAANSSSVTIPTHAVGDLIVIFAHHPNGNISVPSAGGTVPAWVNIDNESSSYANCRTARFIATATNHTSGTWTGANGMIAVVLRGANPTTPIGGHALSAQSATGNTCPGAAVTMTKTDGSSTLLQFYGYGDGVNSFTSIAAAPAGYTRRVTGTYAGTPGVGVCLNTKDVTTSDGAVAQTSTSNCWTRGATVEILS